MPRTVAVVPGARVVGATAAIVGATDPAGGDGHGERARDSSPTAVTVVAPGLARDSVPTRPPWRRAAPMSST